jgi:hypothetical protein
MVGELTDVSTIVATPRLHVSVYHVICCYAPNRPEVATFFSEFWRRTDKNQCATREVLARHSKRYRFIMLIYSRKKRKKHTTVHRKIWWQCRRSGTCDVCFCSVSMCVAMHIVICHMATQHWMRYAAQLRILEFRVIGLQHYCSNRAFWTL